MSNKMSYSKKHRLAKDFRHKRVRKKIRGSEGCPRLCVGKTLKHIYAHIINDDRGITLTSASTLCKEFKQLKQKGGTVEAAGVVGKLLAQKAKEMNIEKVVFDRGGFKYHGQVKALAEAARENGLVF